MKPTSTSVFFLLFGLTTLLAAATAVAQPVDTTIAFAKRDLDLDYYPDDTTTVFRVQGVVTSADLQLFASGELWFEMYFQDPDDNAGLRLAVPVANEPGFDPTTLPIGVTIEATGLIDQIAGVRHLNPNIPSLNIQIIDPTPNPLTPETVTIAQLLALANATQNNAEVIYESALIRIDGISISSGVWPGPGGSATLGISDGTDSFELRIDADTNIGGQPAPVEPFAIIGLGSQYYFGNPVDAGYQILPRSYADIVQSVGPVPPTLLLDPSGAVGADVGQELFVHLVGQDSNAADDLTFMAPNAPPGSTFNQVAPRLAEFRWTPSPADAGQTLNLEFQVDDGTTTVSEFLQVVVSQVIINEVLFDPAAGLAGDANNDGVRDFSDDEFVEIFNDTGEALDLSGYVLEDAIAPRHVFPAGSVVSPGCAVVVFGGGTPQGTLGFALVQTASTGGLSLGNSGDTVKLFNGPNLVAQFDYSDLDVSDESVTRDPDVTGAWTAHSLANPGALFSPGNLNSGVAFAGCSTNSPPIADAGPDQTVALGDMVFLAGTATDADPIVLWEWTVFAAPGGSSPSFSDPAVADPVFQTDTAGEYVLRLRAYDGEFWSDPDDIIVLVLDPARMVINEVLYDPAPGLAGDANGDGTGSSTQDEFVEIINNTGFAVDLTDWTLEDATGIRHVFTLVVVPPGCSVVVFGGGDISGFTAAPAQTASSGSLGLNNNGDSITLKDVATGEVVDRLVWDDQVTDTSLTRDPAVTGDFVPHDGLPAGLLQSPGLDTNGGPFATCRTSDVASDDLPVAAMLYQNTPNPFNPNTELRFATPRSGRAILRVYDVSGRLVRTLLDEVLPRGQHRVVWNGRDDSDRQVASGAYYAWFSSDGYVATRRMMLLK